ncbi:MAG: tRNA nucleotidyltransferase/poly(A) polymerase family protein [Acidobacteriaceae bacterium]
MADYIYLLENRLSPSQQLALQQVREVSRSHGMNVFLTGGAVRDLTSGSPVRDLDVSIQGNTLKLKKDIENTGGVFSGQHEPSQTLFFRFPGGVRVEVSSTRTETYPQPGKPVYHPADLKQDLYRRDFTANAMALSLNEGSYGLLIDPMNGVADIESRYLRLASNYGFIEDPVRLVRATRLSARLGWQMDEKTQARYQTAKEEKYISALGEYSRGYELEEIVHEEDPLKVLKALEAEGWMKVLFPAWTTAKANIPGLQALHDTLAQMQMQGVSPDASAASFELLTAKLSPKEVQALKNLFPRQGFVAEIEGQEAAAKDFAKLLLGKEANSPSATWKLMTSYPAEAVLWLAHTSKNAAVQAKFHDFFVVWPEARQKYPYLMMQEMRITPELPRYQELLQALFFEMMDGKLQTPEEMKAFLEPYSPPAPPPPIHLRRPRAAKKVEGKKPRKKDADKAEAQVVPAEAGEHAGIAGEAAAQLETTGRGASTGEVATGAKPARAVARKPVAPASTAASESRPKKASEPKAEASREAKGVAAPVKKAGNGAPAAVSTAAHKGAAAKPVVAQQAGVKAAKPSVRPAQKSVAKPSAQKPSGKSAAVSPQSGKKAVVSGKKPTLVVAKSHPGTKALEVDKAGKPGAKAAHAAPGKVAKSQGRKEQASKAPARKAAATPSSRTGSSKAVSKAAPKVAGKKTSAPAAAAAKKKTAKPQPTLAKSAHAGKPAQLSKSTKSSKPTAKKKKKKK